VTPEEVANFRFHTLHAPYDYDQGQGKSYQDIFYVSDVKEVFDANDESKKGYFTLAELEADEEAE
jgi:hypothetical protein